ncbi:hypothetical protein U1Q18_006414 [Sarracenia purpurea var. burkii]
MMDDRYSSIRQRENPSFSSTLLDAIYRSIDVDGRGGGGGEEEEELVLYRETMRKTRTNCAAVKGGSSGGGCGGGFEDDDMASLRRACLIEKWMDQKVTEKIVVRRKSSVPDFERKSRSDRASNRFMNSSSTSSNSSSGAGGFSSSEAESGYGVPSTISGFSDHRPKPIRTSVSVNADKFYNQKPKIENGFVKTKSKAMKFYGDLKKVKQPISPGGRLASFLNSIFTPGSAKKAKISSPTESKSAYASTCSSSSSFSRSCLSKTPSSSGGKSSNGVKRSVRFYPVSVIVDEDCQPCGHKSLYKDEPRLEVKNSSSSVRDSINEELKFHMMEKNRRVEEAARDLLKNYQKKVEYGFGMRNDEEFQDEEDDAASCASSDLFELDNLSSIGIERYRQELPVYETTHLDTNRAIANGMIA